MVNELERYHPNEEENLGDILYIGDFYGIDGPQYLTVVNRVRKGTRTIVDRPEGEALLGFTTGRKRYIPNAVMIQYVGPGDQSYLEAIKQNIDGQEFGVVGSDGRVRTIRVIGDLLKFTISTR